jgi:hypothetical protein
MAMQNENGHSANVVMELILNGRSLPIAQMGPDFLLLESPIEYPPALADVLLTRIFHKPCGRRCEDVGKPPV